MGSVYRAVDTKLERPVALKLLRPDRVKDTHERAKGADRLLREARAAATIAHANAVAIYDIGEVEGTPYIAMELVVGRSLRACIGDASVSIEARVRWLKDTARALGAAHARGLVHRDVKPENVMLGEDGTIKVLDFGIASSYGRAEVTTATNWAPSDYDEWFASFSRDGVLVGTPRYMSPEQLNGSALDGRADQFSWAVMAYELLSGTPPWLGDTVSYSTLLDLLHKEPAPLQQAAPHVPPLLARAVHKALSKAADERFASMDQLIKALDEPKTAPSSHAKQWLVMAAVATVSGVSALWLGGSFSDTAKASAPSAQPASSQVIPAQATAPEVVAPLVATPKPSVLAVPQRVPTITQPRTIEVSDAGVVAVAPIASTSATAPARFRDPGF